MPREDEDIQSAFDEQAGSADGSRELCVLFGLDAGGTAAARRDRLLSLAGLSSDTVSNRLRDLMKAAGIDVSAFQPHILRSASMRAAIDAGEAVDQVLERASVSLKVFKVYYDLPKGGQSSGGIESLDGGAAARLLLDLQPSSSAVAPAVGQPLLCDR